MAQLQLSNMQLSSFSIDWVRSFFFRFSRWASSKIRFSLAYESDIWKSMVIKSILWKMWMYKESLFFYINITVTNQNNELSAVRSSCASSSSQKSKLEMESIPLDAKSRGSISVLTWISCLCVMIFLDSDRKNKFLRGDELRSRRRRFRREPCLLLLPERASSAATEMVLFVVVVETIGK
jgi:hypothetical protein